MICALLLFALAAWAIPALVLGALILHGVVCCDMNRYEAALCVVATVFWPVAIVLGIIACSYVDHADRRCSKDGRL